MEDINDTIEHLHAARQLIGVAEFAISKAMSQIWTTGTAAKLEDLYSEMRSLNELAGQVHAMINEEYDERWVDRARGETDA